MLFANKVPPKARDAYRKDAASGMLGAVMMGLTGPFVGVIARKTLNATDFEVAVLTMAPVAGNLFSLLWANMMEGRRKMPYAVLSWIAARALFVAAGLATTSAAFVGIIALQSFVVSIASPAYSAIMKEVYPDGDRARLMGYARVCTIGVFVVVTAIASPLLGGHNYRFAFPVAGVFGVISALVFARVRSDDRSGDSSVPLTRFMHSGLMILRDDPGYRWFCAGIFVYGFANFMAQPVYVIYQVKIGVDTGWAGVYSIVSALAMTFAYFYWGGYIDRKRPEGLIAVQAAVWALIPIIYCFSTEPWMLVPTALLSGVIGAGVDLAYFTGVLHFSPPDRITQYQAVFLSLMGIRGIVGPFVGTALQGPGMLSMQGVFIVSAALILVSAVIQVIGMRRYKSLAETAQSG